MVQKKIKKFFNSVAIHERLPILYEEQKKKNFPLGWFAAGVLTTILVCLFLAVLSYAVQPDQEKESV